MDSASVKILMHRDSVDHPKHAAEGKGAEAQEEVNSWYYQQSSIVVVSTDFKDHKNYTAAAALCVLTFILDGSV